MKKNKIIPAVALAEKYLDQGELSPAELAIVRRLIAKYCKQWS